MGHVSGPRGLQTSPSGAPALQPHWSVSGTQRPVEGLYSEHGGQSGIGMQVSTASPGLQVRWQVVPMHSCPTIQSVMSLQLLVLSVVGQLTRTQASPSAQASAHGTGRQ